MSRLLRKAAVSVLAACGALGALAAPATAADYPTDLFDVVKWDSVDPYDVKAYGYTQGTITWYNRTANLKGEVFDSEHNYGDAVAYFEAYAGSEKIESTTRTANYHALGGSPRDFNFTIGDTDRVGGIDRIKITVCQEIGTFKSCSSPENYSKS